MFMFKWLKPLITIFFKVIIYHKIYNVRFAIKLSKIVQYAIMNNFAINVEILCF